MEHHLLDDTDDDFIIRPATIDDASEITRLSTGDLPLSEEARDAAQSIVAERLLIESGDDYFTIVAEARETGAVAGWLAAGGCRGQEMKGWSEIYAMASEPAGTTLVEEAMLGVALHALHLAKFCGVTTLVERDDPMRTELFEDLGFTAQAAESPNFEDETEHLVHFQLSFDTT